METEERVAKIWAEVFQLDTVAPDADFFELGGTSLHATTIAARVRTELGTDIPLSLFFDATTVAELAAAIDDLVVKG
jgi:acyl carrier protein